MTDVSAVKAYADPQPAPVAFYSGPPPPAFLNGSPALDGAIEEEESSTIKCICGFSDDDGNTVLCEKCDTWQHISCYYESAGHVPDVHECADCAPRSLDKKGAAERQRQRREQHNIGERKGRPRTSTKSHKKRAKDPLAIVQPNGWAVHGNTDLQYNSERKSGSPREQGPPAKRPKTNHRPSNSVHVISQAPALVPGSRKRTGSVMFNGHSPVKSPTEPDGPTDDYSIEFMNLYRQPERPSTDSNSYTDLRVANDIASWLSDRDALAEATGGMAPAEVFQRIEQTMEDMEASHAPTVSLQTEEDPSILAHGLHPQWQFLMVESPVAEGGFIGELKGRIGRKQDYYSDPANRWDVLRHPEPFVFFPPHLPIYIDTRHEGTLLRYARRSCNPNMVMKILTQGPESGYHFCFLATRDIDMGEELTVGWDIGSEIQQHLQKAVTNGDIKKEGFRKIQPWVTGVLANFGGCACDQSTGYGCLLERARRNATTYAEPVQPLRTTKGKKTKKGQFSPLSTGHATNSRAGSEAVHRDGQDDEHMESRSTSGSHKSTSRDITPATHFSVDDSNSKLSERERRKLQQQERLFEQLEEDQHKVKRGKRNSAGSTLNTPGLSSSKQLGQSEHSPSLRTHREHSNGVARKTSGSSNKTNGRVVVKPKPVYVDSYTQTEVDSPPMAAPTPVKARVIRPPVSFKRKLLLQAQEDKLQRDRFRSASVKVEAQSPALVDVASSKPSPKTPTAPSEDTVTMEIVPEPAVEQPDATNATPTEDHNDAPAADVEMPDAEEPAAPRPPSPKTEEMPDAPGEDAISTPSHPPIQPPPPPWPTSASETQITPASEPPATQPEPPRLEVPIKPDPVEPSPSADNAVTPDSALAPPSNSLATQSPVGVAPPSPFSPAVTSAVTPGPARKKLSLSAYTSRRHKLAQQTSQSGVVSSPSVKSPTLSTSSLPNTASPETKATECGLPPVTEENKSPPPAVPAAGPSTSSG